MTGVTEDMARRIHRIGDKTYIAKLALNGLEERDTISGLIELGNLFEDIANELFDTSEEVISHRMPKHKAGESAS